MDELGFIKVPLRLNYSTADKFNAMFESALGSAVNDEKLITLDFSAVNYIDSSGIGLLVMSYKKAQKMGVKMSIINANKAIKDVLLLANVQRLININ